MCLQNEGLFPAWGLEKGLGGVGTLQVTDTDVSWGIRRALQRAGLGCVRPWVLCDPKLYRTIPYCTVPGCAVP